VASTTEKRSAPGWLKPSLRRVYHPLYRAKLRFDWWMSDRRDRSPDSSLPLPPARLRFRVAEDNDPREFVEVGRRSAENLKAALARYGGELKPGSAVLDFGCGCGRTLLWLAREFPNVQWHGTDVDPKSVEWCRSNIPGAQFAVNEAYPPTDYGSGQFDLVYAISVFTHLDADYQRAWLLDLARILRPGGVLMASFHSRSVWEPLEAAQAVRRYGFAFRTSEKLKGIFPAWYQTAFRDPDSVAKLFSEQFENFTYLEGQMGAQDLAIATRIATRPAPQRATPAAS
jgi:SAM-dependent methyltransferase